jgi:hypothetical protein
MVFLSLECHFHGVWEVCGVLVELELRVIGSQREVVVKGLIGEMMVCVLVRGLVRLGVVLLDVPLLVLNTGLGEMIAALGSRGTTDHVFPLVVLVLLSWDMGSLVARE